VVSRPAKRHPPPATARGFTYLGVVYMVAIAGIALAGTGIVWSFESRREQERDLLFVGEEYRRAIAAYASATPGAAEGGTPVFPERLEQLLVDTRSFPAAHHLRRLYRDPLSGKTDWQLIRREGRIVGVASGDTRRPIKVAGFGRGQEDFAGAGSYADWKFIAEVSAVPAAAAK
jgi:type II secretory pathway pseudopilin PulG